MILTLYMMSTLHACGSGSQCTAVLTFCAGPLPRPNPTERHRHDGISPRR